MKKTSKKREYFIRSFSCYDCYGKDDDITYIVEDKEDEIYFSTENKEHAEILRDLLNKTQVFK